MLKEAPKEVRVCLLTLTAVRLRPCRYGALVVHNFCLLWCLGSFSNCSAVAVSIIYTQYSKK